jgi:hypothetical protein
MAVETELQKRKKLSHVNTIEDVVNLIQNSNYIIVLAGAGDQRSRDPANLQELALVAAFLISDLILVYMLCSQIGVLTILLYFKPQSTLTD